MRILHLLILLCLGLLAVCLLPAEADNGYINPKLPNLGCPSLSGLGRQAIMIRNMMHNIYDYKIRCPTVSGSQVNLTWEPNSTKEIPEAHTYNSSLPFHISSPNGTEISYAIEPGKSADIPIEFNLTKGYKMSYVQLSLSGVPQSARIFINPNVSDYFSNQLDKDSVANGTLHVYLDSAITSGNYDVVIVGEGSVTDPSGKEINIKNSVGVFHLDVLPSTNNVWLKVGIPTVHQVIILTKLGSSTMGSGFGGETDIPITVYASQKTPVTLSVDQYPQDGFYKFVPSTVVATSQGANVTMIMAGAGVPNPYFPNALHTDVAKIIATSQYGNSTTTGFLPVYAGNKITILHGPGPINLTSSSFGGNSFFGFKIVGVIYDPPTGNNSTMSIRLSVLGTMNGTKVLSIPSWLKVAFPIPDFTLDADKPYYFVLNFTTQHEFEEPYPVAINENVGGSNFTQVVWLPKESHIVFGGMPQQMSPLKQIKSGTKSKDVTCRVGLQLIIKAEDGTSDCVKPNTAQILIERGWGNTLTPTAWFRYTILDPFESGSNAHQNVPWSNYIPANVSDTAYKPWFNGTAIKEYFTSHGVTLLEVRYSSYLLAGPEGVGTTPQRQTDFYFLTLQNDTSQMNQFGFKMINVDPKQDLSVLGQILSLNN
jgi:hypothetical protein